MYIVLALRKFVHRSIRNLARKITWVDRRDHLVVGAGKDALADVPPTLDWVRLAQRFPVRIYLEEVPDCSYHSGATATVIIRPTEDTDSETAMVQTGP